MLNFTSFILCSFVVLGLYGSPANSQERPGSICLLKDAPHQCGAFCLSALGSLYNQMAAFKKSISKVESSLVQMNTQMDGSIYDQMADFKTKMHSQQESLFKVESTLVSSKGTWDQINIQMEGLQQGQKQLTEGLNKLENVLTNKEERIASQMEDLRKNFDARLDRMQDQVKAGSNKLEEPKAGTSLKAIPPKFELIGSRYFYIEENNPQNWTTAANTCREMGGHLASFKKEDELDALKDRLHRYYRYWIGINDHKEKGDFVSLASGKPAFLNWAPYEPYYFEAEQNCIFLGVCSSGELCMLLNPCTIPLNFICQADDEI
ncbi:accessory gland protein Acp29AB-like [Drosophila rhopaloa]|uniref:Accessory gland protein Acp29AB-like n=1 Tax=Drosophila rhopaloa TaxID=1041015 RepID=A0A6P4FBC0_DRORH|nr:accessory gland protein Acp29AB-like [Drosophila rhopaloa]